MKWPNSYARARARDLRRYHRRGYHLDQWHRWFAWYPVNVGCDRVVWLETVERRQVGEDDGLHWQYRELVDTTRR